MFLSGDVRKSCGFTSGWQSAASAQTAHLGMGIAVYWEWEYISAPLLAKKRNINN